MEKDPVQSPMSFGSLHGIFGPSNISGEPILKRVPTGIVASQKKSRHLAPYIATCIGLMLGVRALMGPMSYFGAVTSFVPPAPIPTPETITETNLIPSDPLSIGGYPEVYNAWKTSHWAAEDQATYLKQKTELQRAIDDCLNGSPGCHPNIKAFADMLERVRVIPDRQIQIEAVQAWGNLFLDYDNTEADGLDHGGDYRSLKQALIDRKAVCKEQAMVKLFALEYFGFEPDNIRWMVEDYFVDGIKQEHPHAVTVARIGDKNWVLNNWSIQNWAHAHQAPYPENVAPRISYEQVLSLISSASEVEEDATELNNSGHSIWNTSVNHAFVPSYSLNAFERAGYDVTVDQTNKIQSPAIDKNAIASTAVLYYGTSEQGSDEFHLIMDAMKTAVSIHYSIDPSIPTPARTTNYPSANYPMLLPHQ